MIQLETCGFRIPTFYHIAIAGQVGSLEPSTVLTGAGCFPTHSSLIAKLPWSIFHDRPHPRIPSGDIFLHYLSKLGFTIISLRVGMLMN